MVCWELCSCIASREHHCDSVGNTFLRERDKLLTVNRVKVWQRIIKPISSADSFCFASEGVVEVAMAKPRVSKIFFRVPSNNIIEGHIC
jgi:hypothetical protein